MSPRLFAALVALVAAVAASAGALTSWRLATAQAEVCADLAHQRGLLWSAPSVTDPTGCLMWGPIEDACELRASGMSQTWRLELTDTAGERAR